MGNIVRVADEIWIAMAFLHRSHPERKDFSINEIIEQAKLANVTGVKPLRPGLKVHAYLHCVANKTPNPGRYRILFETKIGRRPLYRPDDPYHPLRFAGKDKPKRHEIPEFCRELIDWYVMEYVGNPSSELNDSILSSRGLGKEIWADEDTNAYVSRQRTGW